MHIRFLDKLTFGKYRGRVAAELVFINPSYFDWLLENTDHTFDRDLLDNLCVARDRKDKLKKAGKWRKASAPGKPCLTGGEYDWDTVMDFGKYKGRTVREFYQADKVEGIRYLIWMYRDKKRFSEDLMHLILSSLYKDGVEKRMDGKRMASRALSRRVRKKRGRGRNS